MSRTDRLRNFYDDQIGHYNDQLSRIKDQLSTSSLFRLLVFLLAGFGVFVFFGNTKLVLGIVLLFLVLFLFLVSRHTDLEYKRDTLKALLDINKKEIKALERDFHGFEEGSEYQDSAHHFSQDIDLFGKGSFYQYTNRTVLQQGSEVLSGLLLENAIDRITDKQDAVRELSKLTQWRQEFSAIATLVKTETHHATIIKWMQGYAPFLPGSMKLVPRIFTGLSILTLTFYFLGGLPALIPVLWFFIGLGITSGFLRKINKLAFDTSKIVRTFQQYQKLILELEGVAFQSQLLQEKKASIVNEAERTSKTLREFSRLLGALDQRNNVLIALLANGFLLRDIQLCHAIEKWIGSHGAKVEGWFGTIAFFDAFNSLGNFAFNHPHYCFPRIGTERTVLRSEGVGHPLLDPAKSVRNDFQIDSEQFFIITGANMAGKSTFLRTVSLQIVMANTGLPVCAEAFEYSPIKLITSMRTTDSLTDDESYFFSELKRLKFIVDEIKKDRYFIVLDEILKGTNSTDKAKGSRKFVEKLVRSRSTGIIATHDLSLCDTADTLPQVLNHYFDAEIIDNELHFDYTLKKGICQNMNASFLLKKMEIVE